MDLGDAYVSQIMTPRTDMHMVQVDTPWDQLLSEVIESSRRRGYVVTPLFQDDRLVDLWLSGRPVPSPTWKPPPRDPDDSSDAAFEIMGKPR